MLGQFLVGMFGVGAEIAALGEIDGFLFEGC